MYERELFPKYTKRLELMLEQIDLGESKGMMSSARASQLRAEQSSLVQYASEVRQNGFQRSQLDNLDKQLTAFNAEIAHAMVHDTASAGAVH